jgi:6-phosphofructokinase
MGRKAGWLSYGVAIAGEAHMVLGVEDIDDSLTEPEADGRRDRRERPERLSIEKLADRSCDLILTRERRGKHYGTVVLAEGSPSCCRHATLHQRAARRARAPRSSAMDLGKLVAAKVSERYEERTGRRRR